jgi:uncharacterized protein
MISSGEIRLFLDARILSEYHEVLRRPKFRFDVDKTAAILDYIENQGTIVAASPLLKPLPDADDEAFLEVALSGGADCLVTGNQAHFPQRLAQGMNIVSPREFLTAYKMR